MEPCHDQTWNLLNVLHQQDSRFFRFYSRKTRKSRHFCPTLRMGNVSRIYFEQFVSFLCNYLLIDTERVFFCVNHWKFYPSPKFVYMKAARGPRDKFHVWSWHIRCHWHWHWHLTITSRSRCDQFQVNLVKCLQFMTNWKFQIMILMKLIDTQTATLDSICDSCEVSSSSQYSYLKMFQR